jgi:hypothetical protein
MASCLARVNAVTINDVLDGHKLLEINCVDRVYLTLSVPNLVVGGQVVSSLTAHEHNPFTGAAGTAGPGVSPGGDLPRRVRDANTRFGR